MRIFSTFSGIGGFEVGIRNAFKATWLLQGIDHKAGEAADNSTLPPQPLFVGYSEIDKYATSVYERNFGGHQNYGDITKIDADKLPDFDCLVGGFPCQAFSVAGKRGGFTDTRGTLFFDLARILSAKRPRLFVFENVKGLLGHDSGNTFRIIIATIDELGYDCQWQVLNSKDFGVPQNRERVVIVGHLRGTPRPQVFPFTGTGGEDTRIVGQDVAYALDASYHKGVGPDLRRARRSLVNDTSIRRLTPLECERLQAFPDNWTKYGEDEHGVRVAISDSQRYKMCGNAVTTNVIQAVFERIFQND